MIVKELTKKTLIIAALIAIVPFAAAYAQTSDDSATTDDSMMMSSSLTGPVAIGGLFPLSGNLGFIGVEVRPASELAVEDFNAYLAEQGATWWLEMAVEDTESKPTTSFEKIQALHTKGISNVVGPIGSSNVLQAKGYADRSNMLIVSCCSTSTDLSIAGDSVYRLAPSDENQGAAIGKILVANGIEAIVPIWLDDTYGNALQEATVDSFVDRGGTAHSGVKYAATSRDLSLEVNSLDEYVREMVDAYGADKVAVVVISFAEATQILQKALDYEALNQVRWFGSEATAQASSFVEDRKASEFVSNVNFTAVQILPAEGTKFDQVTAALSETLGATPNTFVYPAYDAVWILGKSIMEADSTNSTMVKSVLPRVAAEYSNGAMGSTELNDAGDLLLANYQLWEIINNTWVETNVKYSVEQDILTAANQPTGEVEVGSLYPLTGSASSTGFATREATDLGANDFNAYLERLGVEWRLQTVVEDSTSQPVIADEKVKALFAQQIDIVIGPRPSGEVKQVKLYADLNNMMIISCCSTAPDLGIPGDSVYRLAVDDVHQGAGVSKLFEAEGIKAVVPIWRLDDYGQGLVNEIKDRAESKGYVVSEGIPYDFQLRDFSVSVAELAAQVEEQVNAYSADEVAVFIVAFDESVPIMQSASNYPVLSEIKWFGAETFVSKTDILNDPISSELVNAVQFTAMITADVNNVVHEHVKSHFLEAHGEVPTQYIYSAYDAAWLVGLSILQSGSADAGTVKTVFHDVAANYEGASGNTMLNEAGDLTPRNYAMWTIEDNVWVLTGEQYRPLDDTIIATDGGGQ